MWFNELRITDNQPSVQSGKVTLSEAGQLGVSSCMENRALPQFAPFGYHSLAKEGTTALISYLDGGYAVTGVLSDYTGLQSGEIELRSPSGAFLRLCLDGTINLNGYHIANAALFSTEEGTASTRD